MADQRRIYRIDTPIDCQFIHQYPSDTIAKHMQDWGSWRFRAVTDPRAVFRTPSPVWDLTAPRNHPTPGPVGTSEAKGTEEGQGPKGYVQFGESELLEFLGEHTLTSTTVGPNFKNASFHSGGTNTPKTQTL